MGFVLLQDSKPVPYGLRSLIETQNNYSQLEATKIEVSTDNKPIVCNMKKIYSIYYN